jgi:ribose transport system substrate-binding protein
MPAVVSAAVLLTLSACGSDSTDRGSSDAQATSSFPKYDGIEKGLPTSYDIPDPSDGKDLKFGYLNITSGNELLNALGQGFTAEAKHLGVKSITLTSGISVDKQVSDFHQLLAQGIDGIFVNPLDARALAPVLKKAKAQGVPVIGLDINLESPSELEGFTSQIWSGKDSTAYQQVKSVAEAKPNAQFGTIDVVVPVPGPIYQIKRVKYWAPRFGLKYKGSLTNASDDAAGGQQAATPLLHKYPELEAIIGYNDPSAVGAVAAARTLSRDIAAVGANGSSDGVEGVRNGRLTSTIQANGPTIGAQALAGLFNVATKQDVPLPPTILVKGTVVTADNIDKIPTFAEVAKRIAENGLEQ